MGGKVFTAGILGCGDYLRQELGKLKACRELKIKSLFDPDGERAKRYAEEFDGASAVGSADVLYDDGGIDLMLIFTPPNIRRGLVVKAAEKGKHVITTKPLAAKTEDCAAMLAAVKKAGVGCAVFTNRTDNAAAETMKRISDSGEIGKIALYKQDWLHHYPHWNNWATSSENNGGPFMDAMIHNLNIARYLIGGDVVSYTFNSDNYAQKINCNDTELLKVNFSGGGSTLLFITWAGDLRIFDKSINAREHLDVRYIITDRGWFITEDEVDGKRVVKAAKNDQVKTWPIKGFDVNAYDRSVIAMREGKPLEYDITDAYKDIEIINQAMENRDTGKSIDLSHIK